MFESLKRGSETLLTLSCHIRAMLCVNIEPGWNLLRPAGTINMETRNAEFVKEMAQLKDTRINRVSIDVSNR